MCHNARANRIYYIYLYILILFNINIYINIIIIDLDIKNNGGRTKVQGKGNNT